MSLASRIITALLGLALIVLVWQMGVPLRFQQAWWARQQVIAPVEPPPGPDGRLFTKPGSPAPKPETPKAAQADQGPAPTPQPPAQQTANAEQLAALNKTAAAPQPALKSKLYYRVVVRDGGTLQAGGVVITLGGINARAADATCKDAKGRSWRCGARARVALMRLIHGRAVTCKVPVSGKQKSLTARCSVGGTDLSAWMVTQGWAEPTEPKDPELAEAADGARKKKIGLWR